MHDSREAFGPASFSMGDSNVVLYTVWKDPIVGQWNLTSVNGMSVSLAPGGFKTMKLTASEDSYKWTISTTPASGPDVTSSGTWAVGQVPTNYSRTQTLVFSKQ